MFCKRDRFIFFNPVFTFHTEQRCHFCLSMIVLERLFYLELEWKLLVGFNIRVARERKNSGKFKEISHGNIGNFQGFVAIFL